MTLKAQCGACRCSRCFPGQPSVLKASGRTWHLPPEHQPRRGTGQHHSPGATLSPPRDTQHAGARPRAAISTHVVWPRGPQSSEPLWPALLPPAVAPSPAPTRGEAARPGTSDLSCFHGFGGDEDPRKGVHSPLQGVAVNPRDLVKHVFCQLRFPGQIAQDGLFLLMGQRKKQRSQPLGTSRNGSGHRKHPSNPGAAGQTGKALMSAWRRAKLRPLCVSSALKAATCPAAQGTRPRGGPGHRQVPGSPCRGSVLLPG